MPWHIDGADPFRISNQGWNFHFVKRRWCLCYKRNWWKHESCRYKPTSCRFRHRFSQKWTIFGLCGTSPEFQTRAIKCKGNIYPSTNQLFSIFPCSLQADIYVYTSICAYAGKYFLAKMFLKWTIISFFSFVKHFAPQQSSKCYQKIARFHFPGKWACQEYFAIISY